MAKRVESRRAPRVPLSRERVLRAAIELADDGGIEALSMRRLGQELGVEAMSLYNHVANKDDLLDGITNVVLSEIELPSDAEGWRTAVRRSAISAHDLLRRHRWASSLALSPARNIPVRVRNMEWLLRTFREAGFSADLTYHAYHAVDSHIWGFTLWELGHTITPDEIGDLATAFLRDFPPAEYPYVHEHVGQHIAGFGRDVSAFELVLDLILDGLERARAAA
jgi:AcrR family transcriptional regulator